MAKDTTQPTTVSAVNLDPGIYCNVFPVVLSKEEIGLRVAPRTRYSDMRPLCQRLSDEGWNAQVYAPPNSDQVYAYGPDAARLESFGFQEEKAHLLDVPRLVTRLIADGMAILLRGEGCDVRFKKGHLLVYRSDQFKPAAGGKIKVYRGYDLRSYYWFDPSEEVLAFGLVVDITWAVLLGFVPDKLVACQPGKTQRESTH